MLDFFHSPKSCTEKDFSFHLAFLVISKLLRCSSFYMIPCLPQPQAKQDFRFTDLGDYVFILKYSCFQPPSSYQFSADVDVEN